MSIVLSVMEERMLRSGLYLQGQPNWDTIAIYVAPDG